MLVSQLANENINEDLGWTFINFRLDEENWAKEVKKKLGSIIWCHLFKDREQVGKALREGFHLAIDIAPISETKKESFRKEVALLTLDCLKIAFSRSCSIELEKFMSMVEFETTIDKVYQDWFNRAIYEMTNVERMRLTIMGLEFFGRSRIFLALLDRADDPCLQSSICFSQLYLPPYNSYKTMVRMMKYSTMDTSYGRA
jgi:hypothetical protein